MRDHESGVDLIMSPIADCSNIHEAGQNVQKFLSNNSSATPQPGCQSPSESKEYSEYEEDFAMLIESDSQAGIDFECKSEKLDQ